jgi:vacuolar-type H+-ATPase subunit I/STV1
MKLHKVKITTPGHFIIFNGKKTRTPVLFKNVKEEDLLLLKNQIRQQNLKYYLDDDIETPQEQKLSQKKVNIEELYNENDSNKSTLKKLLEIE